MPKIKLSKKTDYFISRPAVFLWKTKEGKDKVNHLLMGDWLSYAGETHLHEWTTKKGEARSQEYVKVRCRGNDGWLKIEDFTAERALEVNFVDIGQGDGCHIVTPDDDVMLIDAGISDNMVRFLSWRYNLRSRNVEGAPGFDPSKKTKTPWLIDTVVITHPDEDHYGGFNNIFSNPKLTFDKVYHNGIVERPKEPKVAGVKYPYDLGGMFDSGGETYLFDYVTSSAAMKTLVKSFPKTAKRLMTTLRSLYANTGSATVKAIGIPMSALRTVKYLPGFDATKKFSLQVLGPITESIEFQGKKRKTLRKIGNEGETKNGHSVIFKARYRKLRLLLGGDLNTRSQNFLMQSYARTEHDPATVERMIARLKKKKQPLKKADQDKLELLEVEKITLDQTGRDYFEVDVAKACHHGSQHVLDSFIASVNAVATVISSGDNEPHSHPRPDALGAYGKLGRGSRPLIFSTELARSTREFTPREETFLAIRELAEKIANEPDKDEKARLRATLDGKKDRNVAVYGMITLRALGDHVIIAQKLEKPGSGGRKWDIYELHYDDAAGHFTYDPRH